MAKVTVTEFVRQTTTGLSNGTFDANLCTQWNKMNAVLASVGEKSYEQDVPIRDIAIDYEKFADGNSRRKVKFVTSSGENVSLYSYQDRSGPPKEEYTIEISASSTDTQETAGVNGFKQPYTYSHKAGEHNQAGTNRRAQILQDFAHSIFTDQSLKVTLNNQAAPRAKR